MVVCMVWLQGVERKRLGLRLCTISPDHLTMRYCQALQGLFTRPTLWYRIHRIGARAACSADQAQAQRLQHRLVFADASELVHRVGDVQHRGALADAQDGAHFPGGLAFHRPAQ